MIVMSDSGIEYFVNEAIYLPRILDTLETDPLFIEPAIDEWFFLSEIEGPCAILGSNDF